MQDAQDMDGVRTAWMLIDDDVGMDDRDSHMLAKKGPRRSAAWEFGEIVDSLPEFAVPFVGCCRAGHQPQVSDDLEKVAPGFGRNESARHRAPMDLR